VHVGTMDRGFTAVPLKQACASPHCPDGWSKYMPVKLKSVVRLHGALSQKAVIFK
jgi:hypothetical protein